MKNTLRSSCLAAALLLAPLASTHAAGNDPVLVLSANDQRSAYGKGGMSVRPFARPGSISVLNFASFPPEVTHLENVPCSVIGPPTCILSSPRGDSILVAGAMRVDPKDSGKLAPDNQLTWLRLGLNGPEVISQTEVGSQPSGLAFAPGGKKAYVTLRNEGAVALLDLSGPAAVVAGKVSLAKPEDSLSHLALSPDGKTALITLHEKNAVLVASISDQGIKPLQELTAGKGPYDVNFFPDGKRAAVACTSDGAVWMLEKDGDSWKVGQRVPVGNVPEGLDISPDGKWIAASCFEGANAPGPKDKWYGQPARVHLLSVAKDGSVQPSQTLTVEGIPQSAVFTPDGRYLVTGQFGNGNLVISELKDGRWTDTGVRIEVPGQPAALAAGL